MSTTSTQTVKESLGTIQETLLIPLYLRAKETLRPDAIIQDQKAVEIVKKIDYDFSRFDRSWNLQLDIAIRTEIFDERVQDFIKKNPKAIIINLGAGLDGRFSRLDNGQITWIDLDMPDSMRLRRHFYQTSERNHFIESSMFDYQWMEQIPDATERRVLLIAEGLFCYFQEESIKELLSVISQRWPSAEIVFQSISPEYVNRQEIVPAVNQTEAVFRWGIHSGRELEAWDSNYSFLEEWHFIHRYRSRWRWIRYYSLLPWGHRSLKEVMKISQIRLGNQ